MIVHRGAWVLPIAAPPVRRGWIAVERGRIAAIGGPADVPPASAEPSEERQEILLPGLVNAHTHLELSWLRGLVPPCSSMPAWVDRLIARRRAVAGQPPTPIVEGIEEVMAGGTALIGDIANTLDAWEPIARSGLGGYVFHELLGFNVQDPDTIVADTQASIDALEHIPHLRCAVVPHAPFSTSPALFTAIAAAGRDRVLSVHLGESNEEVEFLHTGLGAWRDLLERLGTWDPGWSPPGCGPVEYLERLGCVNERLLAVHGVQLTDAELARLADAGATLVTCPRSNRWTGAGDPPIGRFYDSGVRVAIGTDSLASVETVRLFDELAAVRALVPGVPAAAVLRSATASGAEALGFGDVYGTLEPGKVAAVIGVQVPPDVTDVEEYLLSGIAPGAVRWVHRGALT